MNIPVKKIEIIIEKGKKEILLEEIQKLGTVEIISGKNSSSGSATSLPKYSELKFAKSFLDQFKSKRGLVSGLLNERPLLHLSEIESLSFDSEIEKVVKRCKEIEERLNSLKSIQKELEKEIKTLDKVKDLSISSSLKMKKYLCTVGAFSKKEKDNFLKEIKGKIFSIQFTEDNYFSLVFSKEDESFFRNAFEKYKVREENIFWNISPYKYLKQKEKELETIIIEGDIEKKEAEKMAVFLPKIEALIDFYSWEIEKLGSMSFGIETMRFFRIEAFTTEDSFPLVKKKIEDSFPDSFIREMEISEEDNPPVCIKNKGLIAPFNSVTNVYGLPKRTEFDPTPHLSFFFALFFGLALSDAGYGALLILLSIVLKKILKQKEYSGFFNLFIIGGISTVIAGILTGTFFGTNVFSGYRIIDPMENPIGTLIFMLFLGAFQLFVGIIIGMFQCLKQGDINGGIGEKGGSILFFLGVFLYFLTKSSLFAIIGVILLFLLNILFSSKKGIMARALSGFGALYGIVGYFSDILSYSRLLALGLATGIIAMVINMIAFLFKDMIPIPGINWLVAFMVLLLGHTANLLINALGAFIHSARLQFVEFFSKFMEGGGRHFKPLNKKGRFVEIIS